MVSSKSTRPSLFTDSSKLAGLSNIVNVARCAKDRDTFPPVVCEHFAIGGSYSTPASSWPFLFY
jgi:hypothetical protein